ncbi:hypothetical protein P171DRAFT_244272 [Karstenula rhodostoma CBS 690.94]|uniref:Uncharacterized protein n=1 Tax=Karstenula rhodostoma CBS 690.94 TaxID=1392251 RepID=A0A9P4UEF0_9PLEO|nr:hypothetical protein P171DRAFT_244272 [Karstenula rhodostoma CBS 690.94]
MRSVHHTHAHTSHPPMHSDATSGTPTPHQSCEASRKLALIPARRQVSERDGGDRKQPSEPMRPAKSTCRQRLPVPTVTAARERFA